MKSKFKRIASLCLTAIMTASFAAGNILALADNSESSVSVSTVSGRYDTVSYENVTGKIDLSAIAIQNLSSSVIENDSTTTTSSLKNTVQTLLVTLNQESIVDSMPNNTTATKYLSTFSGERTLDKINSSQERFLSSLERNGISYTLVDTYSTITNTVAIKVNTSYIDTISAMSDVQSVVFSSTYARPESVETTTDATTNASNVYATGIYNSEKYLSISDGSGMTVAILDTGLDYTHEAFNVMPEEATLGMTESDLTNILSTKTLNAVTLSSSVGNTIDASDLYLNAKVPFAYDYADKDTDVYPSYSQHGTHVAGIVAGQAESYTDKNGNLATDSNGDPISFMGVAPNAQLVICKVFTDDLESSDLGGATTEDILAALEDCVLLNVDIINMSLGTSAGFSSISINGDTEGQWMNEVYGKIQAAGINLICAASNDFSSGFGSAFGTNLATNPDSGTVGSPSTFVGAMSVASINGQLSRYMTVDVTSGNTTTSKSIYYQDSSDANSVQYDFNEEILSDVTPDENGNRKVTYKYVVIPGVGQASDYTSSIVKELQNKSNSEKVIAVVKRGTSTFQNKIAIAQDMGADAVIVYNNVAGTIRMSLGDLDNPIPSVAVSMDAGKILTSAASGRVGYITISDSYQAGPFMNDYSSWGATPDLKLKPDITAHGGEITSTVAGGYDEMSGTSMASPNLAGFVALLRSYLKNNWNLFFETEPSATQLTKLSNQIVMSTAETVYDQDGLPYSPRKQGAGLATLENVFTTNAFLFTDGITEDDRPKIELGEDEEKKGVYDLTFYVRNFGTSALTFTPTSMFMTETLSSDGLAVAEKAYLLTDIAPQWTIDGLANGKFTVEAGETKKIQVRLTLSDAEKKYIDESFTNGMYVEGFIKLESEDKTVQCDLNLPFMGFYGDWESSPMLDYSAYEIADFKQDTSYTDDTRPQEQVWATQAYATYYNNKYTIPMGSFLYTQDENADQIYTSSEHAALSRYDIYYGEGETGNYMTATTIKALYAGLLRNAELVTYKLYDTNTGELILENNVYRVNKAYADGGSSRPAQVLLELDPEELGLSSNGQYTLDFQFYFKAEDVNDPDKQSEDNAFSMTFYVDYEAPILEDARIRYYDYKDGNKEKQRVYLDIDVYDNNYAQSVMLCYNSSTTNGVYEIQMATEYVTPIYNSVKNGTNTVSIEITDLLEYYKQGDAFYLQLDDYALNHCVYTIYFSQSNYSNLPSSFTIADDSRITKNKNGTLSMTLGINEAYKLKLDYEGTVNASNFYWDSSSESIVRVKNGEIFGVAAGTTYVTVSNGKGEYQTITVKVEDMGYKLSTPSISFGTMTNYADNLVKASGTVKVNAGQTFKLDIVADSWYYDVDSLNILWSSTNTKYATVDQEGNVTTNDEKGTAIIRATILDANGNATLYAATVTLSVQDPFTVSSSSLTKYHGTGGNVVIPNDKNITTISSEAFKNLDNVISVVIPKTVTTIEERAFLNCKNLKYIYFIQEDPLAIPDAKLNLIYKNAFSGCTDIELIDLSNVKTITLDAYAFYGLTSLKEVRKMSNIGTMGNYALAGCTSLENADITGLHTAGNYVFAGCTSIKAVQTDFYTDLGLGMFSGCTSLTEVTIKTSTVGDYAFAGCTSLKTVNFDKGTQSSALTFKIGANAFSGCTSLTEVNFNDNLVSKIGDSAFYGCTSLANITLPSANVVLGNQVFENTQVEANGGTKDEFGAIYIGTKLLLAPKTITSSFTIKDGTTEIAPYAFSESTLQNGVKTIVIPASVTEIGEGAFANFGISFITLPEGITKINDFTFYHAQNLTTINIPASVKEIGGSAFDSCINLESVTFADNSSLKTLGNGVFYACEKLTSFTFPDGVEQMGSYTFRGCVELVTVNLPSVKVLGDHTFSECVKLESVTFGANATTTGDYTFARSYQYSTDSDGNTVTMFADTALKSVTLSDKMSYIGEGAFNYCTNLTEIDLKNVVSVRNYAFSGCSSLATVIGLENLETIGNYAFADCNLISELNLTKATIIGDYAFYITQDETHSNNAYTTLSIPVASQIGKYAFSGGKFITVNIPATVTSVGEGAFANCSRLTNITVDENNKTFFTDNGVLYRSFKDITTGKTVYELISYPTAKRGTSYTILDGTVTVGNYAFALLTANSLNTVTLPYSVNVVGIGAFYSSGITSYVFECINAPVLLTQYYQTGTESFYTLYYVNFEDNFITHTEWTTSQEDSTLTISYPSNGSGYTNYVFSNYFGTANITEERMNDEVRSLKETIEGFESAEVVSTWATLEVNDANKAMVSNFAESVKDAHRIYNNITSQTQLNFLGEDAVKKLTDIETALKPIKSRFDISVTATSLSVSPNSKHRSTYTAGEKFDMTGLVLIVTYDDYSTEEADLSQLKLSSRFDGATLSTLNRYVTVEGYGTSVQVTISVTEGDENSSNNGGDNSTVEAGGGCTGCGSIDSGDGWTVIGLLSIAAIAFFAVRLIRKSKADKGV